MFNVTVLTQSHSNGGTHCHLQILELCWKSLLCPNNISFMYFWMPMNNVKRKNLEDDPTQTRLFLNRLAFERLLFYSLLMVKNHENLRVPRNKIRPYQRIINHPSSPTWMGRLHFRLVQRRHEKTQNPYDFPLNPGCLNPGSLFHALLNTSHNWAGLYPQQIPLNNTTGFSFRTLNWWNLKVLPRIFEQVKSFAILAIKSIKSHGRKDRTY